jgi:hypothetical protein
VQAPTLIARSLLLPITLRRLRVSAPILLLVAGICVAPLFTTLANDLGIDGIGTNLLLPIVAEALPLARGLATDGLLRMKARRLEESAAITAIIHGPGLQDQNGELLILTGASAKGEKREKIWAAVEFFYI